MVRSFEEEDLFSPMLHSAKRRGLWLGTNLLTVFMAAWVIDRFEQVLYQIVALAVLMPVVASMGIDPALSSAVILTTVTDIIGFLSFLGLASLYFTGLKNGHRLALRAEISFPARSSGRLPATVV